MVLPLMTGSADNVQMSFVYSALVAAREHDMNLLLLTSEEGTTDAVDALRSAMVDGVIVMEVTLHDPRVPALDELGRPAVLIGTPLDPGNLVHVDFDFAAAGVECIDYLYRLGHRHIGFLGHVRSAYQREAGFAVRATDAALELVLARLQQLGLRVPADISVVSICTDELATQMSPHVTNVALPAALLARLAVERLHGLIHNEPQPQATLLAPELRPRGSAGPPTRH
jgi:LacI family transcriptional regulator